VVISSQKKRKNNTNQVIIETTDDTKLDRKKNEWFLWLTNEKESTMKKIG
jgi:hypothetical protein